MPLFWLSLAFLSGILLAAIVTLPSYTWILLAIISVVFTLPPVYRRWSQCCSPALTQLNEQLKIPSCILYPLLLTLMACGALRYQISQPAVNSSFIAYYNDRPGEFVLEGTIVEPPDVRDTYTNLRVSIEQIRASESGSFVPVRGKLLARGPRNTDLRYGDRVSINGKIVTPPENEDFSYRDYLSRQFIYSYISFADVKLLEHGQGNPFYAMLYALRERAQSIVYQLYPDPEASLINGIILGIQTGISEKVQEAFRLTGTSHIIVISGFNISIIAQLFAKLFGRALGRYKGALATAVGITCYTILVGANAAVVRAAILGLFAVTGQLLGRKQTGMNSLAIIAAAMAVQNPSVLWDVSFQLSFGATLGIMLYAEPLTQWFTKWAAKFIPQDSVERLAAPVSEYFLLTLAAQLTTLPIIMYYFNRLSLTSLIANPLILPAQPLLMVLGGMSVITGLIFQPLGQIFAWAAWPFTTYTIRMVEWLATIPHGSVSLGRIALPVILAFYTILFAFTFARSRIPVLASNFKPAFGLVILGVATVLVWKSAFYAPDGLLHVTILEVGTGDAVLVQSPTGRYTLINGGASTNKLSDALGRRLPPFNRGLDWLVVADIDNEDVAGIPGNLERFSPSHVLWAGNAYGTRAAAALWTKLISKPFPITHMQAGQKLDLGSGAVLHVVSVDAHGGVLLVEWENFRLLLPLGLDEEVLEALKHDMAMRNISALLLAESGYAPLNPPDLISSLRPQLALLSVVAADKSGLPSAETLEALQGYNLLRTDVNGWIEIKTDGKLMWVEVERK